MEISRYLEDKRREVDHFLNQVIPAENLEPTTLHEAMRYSVFAGGKRIRPILALAAAEAFGEPPKAALAVASSLELIHTYSLIHDDLPAMPFDRGWVTVYDPIAGAVEVIGLAGGDPKGEKKDLKPGQRLALETSASGWSIRHRKPRVDHDLASTQGRFQDHKHLYKERYLSALVVPFFIRGQVGGTVTLASRAAMPTAPKISVIGAGAWGTSLARHLANKGFPVRLWAFEPEVVEAIQRKHAPDGRRVWGRPGRSRALAECPADLHRGLGPAIRGHRHDRPNRNERR